MNSLENLAMLNPKSNDVTKVQGGFGGLTPEEVSGALAMSKLSPITEFYIRTKYVMTGDEQANAVNSMRLQRALRIYITMYHLIKDNDKRWNGQTLRRFCDLMVRLDINVMRCVSCNGTGHTEGRPCLPCNSSGRSVMTKAAKANWLGIDVSNYFKKWAIHEQEIIQLLSQWEANANRLLWQQLTNIN